MATPPFLQTTIRYMIGHPFHPLQVQHLSHNEHKSKVLQKGNLPLSSERFFPWHPLLGLPYAFLEFRYLDRISNCRILLVYTPWLFLLAKFFNLLFYKFGCSRQPIFLVPIGIFMLLLEALGHLNGSHHISHGISRVELLKAHLVGDLE